MRKVLLFGGVREGKSEKVFKTQSLTIQFIVIKVRSCRYIKPKIWGLNGMLQDTPGATFELRQLGTANVVRLFGHP